MKRKGEALLQALVAQGLITEEDLDTAKLNLWLRGAELTPPAILEELCLSGRISKEVLQQLETVSSGPTHPVAETNDRPPALDALPDRFTQVEPLGAGGMGTVVRAFDTVLQRWVAIKVLRPSLANLARVLEEARAQAQVEHPHVCPIYDVVEDPKAPFIVMRYIPGPSLGHLSGRLSAQQVAKLGAQLAQALDAAHRRGLLHRDVKPANVLVESVGGEPQAVLLDFGIAREEREVLAGTPGFIAPEVLRGEEASERSDVFGLGATLFAALAGKPPMSGSILQLVDEIRQQSWRPPSLPPSVPEDLRLIVAKALAADPNLRYPTAHALAEDLHRFLAGEPVLAHPPSRWYRLKKRVGQRPGTYLAVFSASLAVLAAGGVLIWNWREAKLQASLRNSLLTQVMSIENQWRATVSRDVHSITQERKQMLAKLEESVALARKQGLAEASLLLLQGRGFLSLGEVARARQSLEEARKLGLDNTDLRQALGIALLREWQEQEELARRIQNRELRISRERELERKLRDPARSLLQSLRLEPSSHLLAAQLAISEGNFQEAQMQAEKALTTAAWPYEAELLAGDACLGQARLLADQGKYDQAQAELQKASRHYARAATLAPSLVASHLGEANTFLEWGNVAVETGMPPEEWWAKARQAAELAQTVDGESLQVGATLAMVALREMDFAARRGKDSSLAFSRLQGATDAILRLNPKDSRALGLKGIGLRLQAISQPDRETATKLQAEALRYLEAALEQDPTDTLVRNNVGLIHLENGMLAWQQGADPRRHLEQAAQAFQALLQDAPDSRAALDNLGATFWLLAESHGWKGESLEPWMTQAEQALEKARLSNPQDVVALTNLAVCAMSRASYKLRLGEAGDAELRAAERFLQQVRIINPQEPTLATNQLRLLWLRMRQAQRTGGDTGALFQQGQRLVAAIQDLGSNPEALGLAAGIYLIYARQVPKAVRERLFQQAAKLLGDALSQAPKEPELLLFAAELSLCSQRRYLPRGFSLAELETRWREGFPIHRALAGLIAGQPTSPTLESLAPGLFGELALCR